MVQNVMSKVKISGNLKKLKKKGSARDSVRDAFSLEEASNGNNDNSDVTPVKDSIYLQIMEKKH